MEDVLLAWLHTSHDRHLVLRVAGRLSGIHGWRREHLPIAYQVIDSTVIMHFEGLERLTISDALGVMLHPDGQLVVRDASEVRFPWSSDKDPAKDCEEIFRKVGRSIMFSRTDDLYTTSTTLGFSNHNFVMLRYER